MHLRGLQFVFAKPFVAVDPAILDQYTGIYQVGPEFKIKIMREEGRLVAMTPDSSKLAISAESDQTFISKANICSFISRKMKREKWPVSNWNSLTASNLSRKSIKV